MLANISFLLLAVSIQISKGDSDCQSRDFGNGGTVCVCNSTYCDTVSRPEKIEAPQYLRYTSNKAGLRFQKEIGTFEETNIASENQIIVDSTVQYQEILGWGSCFTDSTGISIKSLDDAGQENLMKTYFSDTGIEYNLCRVPMGGTDFSLRGYCYDDGPLDKNLTNFNLTQEDFLYKIPYIKQAANLTNNNLQLFTSAWTAPKWMKTNHEYSGFGFLLEEFYQTWADYFVKFLEEYEKEGIQFWGITTGNEPSLGYLNFSKINSVGWIPTTMGTWILNNLGPTIRNSKFSEIKIMALDDQRFFLPWFLNIALQDNETRNYIDGIAVHWYGDFLVNASWLNLTHERFPEKFILGTEACPGNLPDDKHVDLGSWQRGEDYANDIIDDLLNWVEGWVDWNLALDTRGGPSYIDNFVDAPIIVNATANEFYKQPMYYNLGHFSKFIPRGSVRVSSTSFDTNVTAVALQRPDNGSVLVILNKKEEAVPVKITDKLRGSTDIMLTEKSITTLLYW